MHIPVFTLVVLWFCFGLSLIAVGAVIYAVISMIIDDDDQWDSAYAGTFAELVSVGFITCTLILLNHPIAAVWSWRVLGAVTVFSGGIFSFRAATAPKLRVETVKCLVLYAVTVACIFFFVCSVIVRSLPSLGTAPYQVAIAPLSTALTRLDFWHTALFAILAVTVVLCGVLFVTSTQREGPLSFEKNWGGLGGSGGGWQVSSSLTYFAATIFLGALFLVLIFHEERVRDAPIAQPTVKAAAQHAL